MIETIEAALQPIRNSLEVDGFDLRVDGINDGIVSVVVFAGPDACLECLIPRRTLQVAD
jgi:Fe-S cluster biogenesis protein NfuA